MKKKMKDETPEKIIIVDTFEKAKEMDIPVEGVNNAIPLKTKAEVWINGYLNRTYTLEVHGEDFEQMAHSFADQYKGSEVK